MITMQTSAVTCAYLPQVSRSGHVLDDGGQLWHAEEQKIYETHQSDLRFGESASTE